MLNSEDAANLIANRVLEPLTKWYGADDIEEVVVNKPGEIWVKRRRDEFRAIEAPDLTYDFFAKRLCPVLANINGFPFDETTVPIVACELPGAPYRFQCVVGPNVRYETGDRRGVALAIRSLLKGNEITFANYGLEAGSRNRGANTVFSGFTMDSDDLDLILSAVENHMSILVSGPTSSGKTTFINQVIQLIDHRHRVISVEDARELNVPQPNRVHFVVPRHQAANHMGYNEIIDCLMRLTPDWILCGEVSVSNAAGLYSLMGKGHPIMSTVHAGSPEEALKAFANNMMTDGVSSDADSIIENLSQEVGCIIQLTKKRQIATIEFPALTWNKKAKNTQRASGEV